MKKLLRALQYFRPDAGRVAFAFGLLLFSTGANLLTPWPLAVIIDSVLGAQPLPRVLEFAATWEKAAVLMLLGLAILLVRVSQAALAAWQNLASIEVGLRALARVRGAVFHWLQRLSMRFHQGTSQGDVIYRASWDTYAFQTLFQHGVFTFAQATLSLALMVAVMWRMSVPLTLISIATVPLLIATMKAFGRQMNQRSLSAHQADSQVTSLIQQTIAALPLIQAYTREEHEEERFQDKAKDALQRRIFQHRWEVVYGLAVALGFAIGTAAVTWLGAREVLEGQLSLGQLMVFLTYLAQFYDPLTKLSHLGATVSDASAGVQRVFELLDAPEEVKEAANARSIAQARGRIDFDNVSFGYDTNRPVLRSVKLMINPGESIAIIGPSGAGKTTLLQLLPRFYDPGSGTARLDGVDLREFRLKDLRAQISLVLQEPLLLPATIAENIAYGKPEATRAEVEAAACAAHAAEFIEQLPLHYDTLVGEGAARLSVGEKQRINLARAFLKDAPILAFDEPTSALDAESEALVLQALQKLIRGRTALLVAHRLMTLRIVDKIAVVEAGCITGFGAPDQLFQQSGYFRKVTSNLEQGS